jgi:hypothetical protein
MEECGGEVSAEVECMQTVVTRCSREGPGTAEYLGKQVAVSLASLGYCEPCRIARFVLEGATQNWQ